MVGYFFFLFFFLMGILIAYKTFYELPGLLRIWIGGLIGLLGMMWLVIPVAFFAGFSFFAHVIALIIMGGFSLLWFFLHSKSKNLPVPSIHFDSRIFWIILPFSIFLFIFFIPIIYFPTKMVFTAEGMPMVIYPFILVL